MSVRERQFRFPFGLLCYFLLKESSTTQVLLEPSELYYPKQKRKFLPKHNWLWFKLEWFCASWVNSWAIKTYPHTIPLEVNQFK
jgi:hypothetical protein